MKKYILTLPLIALIPKVASAHCPLCTVGAGVLAVLAASLGISSVIVGLCIGAFALALGLWISKMVQKQYIPFQKHILTLILFLGTVVPILPLVQDYGPLYIPFIGEYGTTYTINLYLLGVIMGACIMYISPLLSKALTNIRGKQIPFQGVLLTGLLLTVAALIIQLVS